jgi:hypothetical protein
MSPPRDIGAARNYFANQMPGGSYWRRGTNGELGQHSLVYVAAVSDVSRLHGGGDPDAGFGNRRDHRNLPIINEVMLRSLPVGIRRFCIASATATIAAWKAVHKSGGGCFPILSTSG